MMWPSSSPDLNLSDYSIWGAVERMAYGSPHPFVKAMKSAVGAKWEIISKDFIQRVCTRFRLQLEACVAANGGHFEK